MRRTGSRLMWLGNPLFYVFQAVAFVPETSDSVEISIEMVPWSNKFRGEYLRIISMFPSGSGPNKAVSFVCCVTCHDSTPEIISPFSAALSLLGFATIHFLFVFQLTEEKDSPCCLNLSLACERSVAARLPAH
jgi:hypothetical protein